MEFFETSDEENYTDYSDTDETEILQDSDSTEDLISTSRSSTQTKQKDIKNHNDGNCFSGIKVTMVLFLLTWQKLHNASDASIKLLLLFMKQFLILIGKTFSSGSILRLAEALPSSLYLARKTIDVNRDNFDKYVMCPKCNSCFNVESTYEVKSTGRKVPIKCGFINYPKHPQKRFRQRCGTFLLKKVIGKDGKEYLYPKREYCYRSPKKYIEECMQRQGFWKKCCEWKKRNLPQGQMSDVYDGCVWRDNLSWIEDPLSRNLVAMVNIDWFQPYKHSVNSVGAIYMVLLNLPRSERYIEDNMFLVGLIPGPKEPKGHINSYLEPLVNDLEDLNIGVTLKDESPFGNLYKLRVLCMSSDIPATRKIGGFVGHTAFKGCSKCLKEFSREAFSCPADYSDFSTSTLRSDEEHIRYARQWKDAHTKAEQYKIERESGARFTELMDLSYFKPVTFHVIDPMHNLLLGTAKRVMQIWKDTILSEEILDIIQVKCNNIIVPSDIGRLPNKISTGFSGFSADQWRTWTCVYSLYVLKDVIPNEDYIIWSLFVKACNLLCTRIITYSDIDEADLLLKLFCTKFADRYGKEKCTINMHLHSHLKQCILDYGPIFGFWCFSFERYNGILGAYSSNNRNIECQLMRKFVQSRNVVNTPWPLGTESIQSIVMPVTAVGSVNEMSSISSEYFIQSRQCLNYHWQEGEGIILAKPCQKQLSMQEKINIVNCVKQLFTNGEDINVSCLCWAMNKASLYGDFVSTKSSRNSRSSIIYAKWLDKHGIVSLDSDPRPGIVDQLLKVRCILRKDNKQKLTDIVLCKVRWFGDYPRKHWFASPVEIYGLNFVVSDYMYIPIQRILCRAAIVQEKVQFESMLEKVTVVLPLKSKAAL